MDDSPAARVKSRIRVRRRRASSEDDEPRPATKRRYKAKNTAQAEVGARAGDDHSNTTSPEVSCNSLYRFTGSESEEDTKLSPSETPLFDFGSPQESWLEASESPSPTKSVKFRLYPASFYSAVKSSVHSTCIDGPHKPRGRKVYLGPGYDSSIQFLNASKFLTDNSNPWGFGGQYSNSSEPVPEKSQSDTGESHKISIGSKTIPSGATRRLNSMDQSNKDYVVQNPNNEEMYMDGPSGPSAVKSSTTDWPNVSPYPLSLSGNRLPQTLSPSVRSSEFASDGPEVTTITEWQPARLLCMDDQEPESQYALLVLNQPIENLNMLRLVWKKAFFRIAADGAANRLSDAFKDPCLIEDFEKTGLDVICGDLDSLFNRVRADAQRRGTRIVEDPDQDSTDFTKCVSYLRGNVFNGGHLASNIVCLGGLGGRVDQALSQLHHLYREQQDYNRGRIYLLSTEGITFVLKNGTHRIRVHDPRRKILGKHVGVIPLKEPSTITTKGLEWDVTDWQTKFGGQISTSNHVREDFVEITTTGDVLFTIDLTFPPGNHEHPELRREMTPIISMGDDMFFSIETNRYFY